jgi:S1-C subfamily serine protease
MKLFSRTQVVVAISISVAVTALAVSGMAILFSGRQNQRADNTNAVQVSTSVSNKLGMNGKSDILAPEATPVSDSTQTGTRNFAPDYTSDEKDNISIYESYNKSVVNITTEVVNVNWFLQPVPQSGGSGSGSIIDPKGYVLTNNHVVKDAYKLFVNLADGKRYEAKLVGADPQNDLAVIKFDPPAGMKLNPIPFGTAKTLKVGQKVLAIGNPFGLERTLTEGIVSGLGRPIQEDSTTVLQNMIQTDASINPGNSGGPLLDSRGEIVGINTMIYSPSGGSVGIGFAIPVDTAARIVPQLIKDGKVHRGWIDFETVQLFPALVDYLKQNNIPSPVDKGLLVSSVPKGSNAEKAGLRGGTTGVQYGNAVFYLGGDIIVDVDGKETGTLAELHTALENTKPGQKVTVEFYRGNRKMKADVVLSEQK